jgi:hypothetical protein
MSLYKLVQKEVMFLYKKRRDGVKNVMLKLNKDSPFILCFATALRGPGKFQDVCKWPSLFAVLLCEQLPHG